METKTGSTYVAACRERVLDCAGVSNPRLDPRWGELTWAAAGWLLSGPEYLVFFRLFEPREPDLLGVAGRTWLNATSGKWMNADQTDAHTVGLSAYVQPNDLVNLPIGGLWYWRQEKSRTGPINEQLGSLSVLLPDGTAWFASFDGISYDTDTPSFKELDKALHRTYQHISHWPAGDLFPTFGISAPNTLSASRR